VCVGVCVCWVIGGVCWGVLLVCRRMGCLVYVLLEKQSPAEIAYGFLKTSG
jgi:hypothetical protein